MKFLVEDFFRDVSLREFNKLVEQNQPGGLGSVLPVVVHKLQAFEEEGDTDLWDMQQFIEKEIGLKVLGAGTQRVVFDIDGDHVLKLALNSAGQGANKKESSMQVQGLLRDLVPRVYMSNPNGKWVVMDRVYKIEEEDQDQWFEDAFGIDPEIASDSLMMRFGVFCSAMIMKGKSMQDALKEAMLKIKDMYRSKTITPEQEESILESPVLHRLIRLIVEMKKSGLDYSRVIGDMYDKNMGRDSDGNPVIIDWG